MVNNLPPTDSSIDPKPNELGVRYLYRQAFERRRDVTVEIARQLIDSFYVRQDAIIQCDHRAVESVDFLWTHDAHNHAER